MHKRLRILLLTLVSVTIFSVVAGAATVRAANTAPTTKAVTIASIAMVPGCPQVLINKQSHTFETELKKLGYKTNFISTRSLNKIWPIMDQAKGDPEFVYLPTANFVSYITETSHFGGSNKYAIIAGSSNANSTVLVVRQGINSLKDLKGKTVGIANVRYSDEFQLNKMLNGAGLASSNMGGDVKVVYDDIVAAQVYHFKERKYDAIVIYGPENYPGALARPGSKILTPLNPNKLFGDKQPRIWLVARKDVIKNNPKLVKTVLNAHYLLTKKAMANASQLPILNRDDYLAYCIREKAPLTNILKVHTPEFYKKQWLETQVTYDPNMPYVTQVYRFMSKRGLMKNKTIKDFVQIDPLNQKLRELKKPVIK